MIEDLNFITDIPYYNNGTWETMSFEKREDFTVFVKSLFKEPGQYNFDETAKLFNEEGIKFKKQGYYCSAPLKTKDFIEYWNNQKEKCRKGVIYTNGKDVWYLPRDYYMWINFLPIYDKVKKKFDFPDIWDSQYHMSLYELLAELHYLHAAVLKKRQFGSSYYHMAKLINQIWFEEGVVCKIGASLKKYINAEGSWKYLNEYKNFLNTNTAWYRPMNPDTPLMWQQKQEVTINGRKSEMGLKGNLQGTSFEKDPTSGVGGGIRYFFHEEAGIAPLMDKTVEYLFPALQAGNITTGTFIAAGSVGDLDQCNPLKEMILRPTANSIYPVETNLIDSTGKIGLAGLFIPEQWSMPPFIDEYGNSDVEGALNSLNEQFEQWKKELDPEKYQLRVSQRPRNIHEAFATRKISKFPLHLVAAQKRRILDKEYAYELLDLERDEHGVVKPKKTNKIPINEFPIRKSEIDKEGCMIVWERPDPNAKWGTYYASIDPVSEGKTISSESLCSIYVYRNPIEVTKENGDTVETYIKPDQIVAAWCGRFDDLTKTHQKLEMIIEWYNAWTIIENNISNFITYMQAHKKQKYLVPRNQMIFLRDISSNNNVFQEYGWKNTGTLFKSHLLSYLTAYLSEEIDTITKEDGTVVKRVYGIERIPDVMAMEEMEAYDDDVNVDRLVALSALIAFASLQQANRSPIRVREKTEVKLENSNNLFKLTKSPFRSLGNNKLGRSPFKNIR
jgi:hypothetical protein